MDENTPINERIKTQPGGMNILREPIAEIAIAEFNDGLKELAEKQDCKDNDPDWCRVCGEKSKMIDSRDAMTEHWECIKCKTINIFRIADERYRGGVPEKLVFESIL
jgi:hypothetical protein